MKLKTYQAAALRLVPIAAVVRYRVAVAIRAAAERGR